MKAVVLIVAVWGAMTLFGGVVLGVASIEVCVKNSCVRLGGMF
jgi:hypothetical protein